MPGGSAAAIRASGWTTSRRSSESSNAKARRRPDVPPAIARHAHFLEPKLVAQIAFRGWTRDNLVRQGSFKGLRTDKPPSEIVRERAMPKARAR